MVTKVSGFVMRTKGKVSFGGQMPLQELPVEYITPASTNLYPSGISIIANTTGNQPIFTLGQPETGTYKTIIVSTVSSGHVVIKTNSTVAGATFVGVDSTTACIWAVPSTTAQGIVTWHGLAASSVLWVTVGFSTSGSTAGLWGTAS